MKAKEVIEGLRSFLVRLQWADQTKCISCAISMDHVRSCRLAGLLEDSGRKDDCPKCYARATEAHAPQCPKAAKS